MTTRFSLALVLLLGCAEPAVDTATYHCTLLTSCGKEVEFSDTTYCGTTEEVAEWAHEWSESCRQLTDYLVYTRECPYVACGVVCKGSEAVGGVCE